MWKRHFEGKRTVSVQICVASVNFKGGLKTKPTHHAITNLTCLPNEGNKNVMFHQSKCHEVILSIKAGCTICPEKSWTLDS